MFIIKKFFIKRKMKRLIKHATEIIYSKRCGLFEVLNREMVGNIEYYDLLCTYIAFEVASDLKFPLNKRHIDYALEELASPYIQLETLEEYQNTLSIFKAKAEVSLAKLEIDFLINKIAFDNNEYSYDGIKYKMEQAKKGPLSLKENENCKQLANQMFIAKNDLQKNMDANNLEQK
jgi:hypothetical protein